MTEDIELYEAYFQKSIPYYLDKWYKFKNGQKFTFNLFTFLFGLFWLMYRKMYLEALVVLIAILGEGFLEDLILPQDLNQNTGNLINVVATIVISTIIGFLGNFLYIRKTEKAVLTAKTKYIDLQQQKDFLLKKGGVSFIFLIVILVIIVLVFVYNNYLANNGI